MEVSSDPTYTHFSHAAEFFELFDRFIQLSVTDECIDQEQAEAEDKLVDSIGSILDHYLPLPTLLDPHLQAIVPPLLEILRNHFKTALQSQRTEAEEQSSTTYSNLGRLERIGRVLNWTIKLRGWKAIITYFPSEVTNLPMLLTLLSTSSANSLSQTLCSSPSSWELRAVLLLWLSLMMTIPFNLSAFDLKSEQQNEQLLSRTAIRVESVCQALLYKPSKEGEYAALVLARLYARPDCTKGLQPFLSLMKLELERMNGEYDEMEAIYLTNILTFLAVIPSLLFTDVVQAHLTLLREFHQSVLRPRFASSNSVSASSSLLRKQAVKAEGRWWLVKLSGGNTMEKRKTVATTSTGGSSQVLQSLDYRMWQRNQAQDVEDYDPPDGFEDQIQELLETLSDKDTIVRYSAAKYIARLAAVLPTGFAEQIVEAIVQLFEGTETEPVVETARGKVLDPGGGPSGDSRWHGVCLALAEAARRGLVTETILSDLLPWVIKALTFDIRRGSHSVGSNVRDAASYLIWSLARASDARSIKPFATEIATKLVTVACFDREVGIRRAASAAFQEHVGRMGLFPHGIDVLGKTDFYAVSVRRTAFYTAAVDVAIHDVYRSALLDCLHFTTLRHWDPMIRSMGAQSLRAICNLHTNSALLQRAVEIEIAHLTSFDTGNIHGALQALSELATVFRSRQEEEQLNKIQSGLVAIRPSVWTMIGSDMLLEAGAHLLVATACTTSALNPTNQTTVGKIITLGMKSKKESVQTACAEAIGAITGSRDGKTLQKQAYALALGRIDYREHKHALDGAVQVLSRHVRFDKTPSPDVELRKAAYDSLVLLVEKFDMSQSHIEEILQLLLLGLGDYTTDQRGDVGSWIRTACSAGIGRVIGVKAGHLNIEIQRQAILGLVRLALEKLEVVRVAAGAALKESVTVLARTGWMGELRDALTGIDGFKEVDKVFLITIRLLPIPELLPSIVSGLVLAIGCKNRDVSTVAIAHTVTCLRSTTDAVLEDVTHQLAQIASASINSPRNSIALNTTVYELTAADVWPSETSDNVSNNLQRLIRIVGKGTENMKNVDRLVSSVKVIASLLKVEAVRQSVIPELAKLLGHAYPRIRVITVEHLYLILQELEAEDEELDEMLLSLDWSIEEGRDSVQAAMSRLKVVLDVTAA